ncbi:hypothetical protein GNY06_06595 [Elizabethkingia argentiflava]|uniref:Lipocalin-like domain-containing protein n=1 Tax=Elizabethkingia argenteiflava TaxID=2681556 RepID=A0A845PS57_9FLAO|nr:lipocalin family protein [Elizabethkingia argenteiflava]NAW51052.1 hypothetical protein [Elizabethkingia argenteiflava]
MKNLLLAGVLGSMVAASCSTANQAQSARNNDYKLKGTWQVTNVDYDKNYKIKPFDEGVDVDCFVGSQWKLVPNNNTGSYSLSSNNNCPEVTTRFKFDVTPGRVFSFKKIPSGVKAKSVKEGYFLQLQNQSPNAFDLVQTVGDTPVNVVYHFQKIN